MSDLSPLQIQSHKGMYEVRFVDEVTEALKILDKGEVFHYVIDQKVLDLYSDRLSIDSAASVLPIVADENNKSLGVFASYVTTLLENGVKRDHTLIAIGGGVIQDICCFLAATMFRGMRWCMLPTTLLAQTDSCIGSKSSINVGEWKNILGTFTPPNQIVIAAEFLKTLSDDDLRSGMGEMLKIQLIDGKAQFVELVRDREKLFTNSALQLKYLRSCLKVKQRFIEEDEFDKGIRNILNYGHSFGHAIESATAFGVPHGIAVTIGMDMANFVSMKRGVLPESDFEMIHQVLLASAGHFASTKVRTDAFMRAISKDKKNVGGNLNLILPDAECRLHRVPVAPDEAFKSYVTEYFS